MPDELDIMLLRRFAESRLPLHDAQFVAQVGARLPARSWRHGLPAAFGGALQAALIGLSIGIVAPLRLRNAGVVAIGALATLGMVACGIFQSSL
jgi:hypothetical protein